MKRPDDVRRLLRWYPTSWRTRYEDEFLAFLEDRLKDSPLTWSFRSSVALEGLRERCYGSGLVGARGVPATQRRTGSLVVFVAWSIMAVGGAIMEKTAEHFSVSMPQHTRSLAQFAYDTTVAAGVAGSLLVVVGSSVALPGFIRFLRAKKWPAVRRSALTSAVALATLAVATLALSAWAHDLTSAQRNGADGQYSAAFVAYAALVVVTIGLWTKLGVAVASRIDFTARELLWESRLALAVTVCALSVIAGTALWWVQMIQHASWFLDGTPSGIAASPWSTNLIVTLVVTLVVMTVGTVGALWGASRVALTYRRGSVSAR